MLSHGSPGAGAQAAVFVARASAMVMPLAPAALNTLLIATHAYLAVGYFGPERLHSGPSYAIVLSWMPNRVWGWALVGGAVASIVSPYLLRWPATALRILALAPLVGLAAAFAVGQVTGVSTGWGATGLLVWPIAGHLLLIAARHHPRTTRR